MHDTPRGTAEFHQAVSLHQQGRPFQADAVCVEVLQADPEHYGAWHLRGLLALESGSGAQGIEWIERSLQIQPNQPAAHSNLGNALLVARKPQEALECFERALRLKSDYFMALYNRGNALRELRRFDAALASYDQALRVNTDDVRVLNNRGLVLLELERSEEAVASFRRTTELDPKFEEGRKNLAEALLKAASEQAKRKYFEDAFASCTEALQLDPRHVGALIQRGDVSQSLQRHAAALEDYEQALALEPDSAVALNNSGNALMRIGRVEAALARYDKSLQLSPGLVDGLINRGAALQELKRYEESARCFDDVVKVAPDRDYVLGSLFHARLDACDWSDYESLTARLLGALAEGKRVVNPFTLLLLPAAPALPLECISGLVQAEYPVDTSLGALPRRATGAGRKIRLAYVSSDFRDHPVSYLLAGVFERHDRDAFEISAISLRPAQKEGIGRRLHAAFDQFIEVENRTDREVAQLLRELDVDIAVDLNGLTEGLRPGIFAHRAAPAQVSYLGYPGTMGTPYIDYILADEFVIPPGSRQYYSEQVVYLPECYQANDDRCEVGAQPTRAESGLPGQGLVLCCFNNNYKLNPPLFDIWMRLLRAVPGSVLWLLADREATQRHLLREAAVRGVDERRLVFAGRMPYPQHLGRLGLADLFLDTLPYNAGTTASDALRMGVPVLTCPGELFVSRMAGSLLRTVGLPELITTSLQEYERIAIELSRQPERLHEVRSRLARQRGNSPLFDTARFVRHLEAAYQVMYRRSVSGEAPVHFAVPTQD